jgi:hypothetical protein
VRSGEELLPLANEARVFARPRKSVDGDGVDGGESPGPEEKAGCDADSEADLSDWMTTMTRGQKRSYMPQLEVCPYLLQMRFLRTWHVLNPRPLPILIPPRATSTI